MKKFYSMLLLIFYFCLNMQSIPINQEPVQEISLPYVPQKKLKILFVLHEFPKFIQQFILNLITGLIDLGHEIFIYANKNMNGPMPQEIEKYKLLERTFYKKLPEEHRQFDIIFCQFGPDGYCGLYLKKLYGLTGKLITCFRGDDLSKLLKPHPSNITTKKRGPFTIPCYFSAMYDELFAEGDMFLPVCKHFKNKLLSLGCPQEKIFVHHSAINTQMFNYHDRPKKIATEPIKILSVGRLVEKKGIKYGIKAVHRLLQTYPMIEYSIIGNGPLYEKLAMLIKRLHAENNIKLIGWLNQEEVLQHLHNTDIFLLPAIEAHDGDEEGIPNVLKEAMATGLPIISTYHSGIPELVEHWKNGFLVRQKNISQLIKRIEYLIKHHSKGQKMGIEGRKIIEKDFETKALTIKLSKLFETIVKN